MRISLPRSIIRTIQRAIVEFELLEPGDRVLVGLSGGKDSTLLLYALSVLKKHLPFTIELAAFTADMGFKPQAETDLTPLEKMCESLEVPFHTMRAELGDEILHNPKQNPCSCCSYFRRAIIHNFAKGQGFNKVAFAHHYDDAVETFLMGILYSGQVATFLPKTYLDKTGITVIRPLVYLRENDIRGVIKKLEVTPMPSPCPLDGITKRAAVKEMIRGLRKDNINVFDHLAAAMREGRPMQLWPGDLTKEEIRRKSHQFWFPEVDNML